MQNTPASPEESLSLAETCRLAGNLPAAEAALNEALKRWPDFHPACHALGLLAFEGGRLPLAAEWIERAIGINGAVGLYHRNLCELYRRLGRLDDAVAAGRTATALMPLDVDAHFNLGLVFSDQGNWSEAIAAYRNALTRAPNHGLSWNNLGVALERSGHKIDAEAAYVRAVQINPNHVEAQVNLATIYKQQGRLEDARRCVAALRELAPPLAEKLGAALENALAPIDPPGVCVRDTCSVKGRGMFARQAYRAGEVVESAAVVLIHSPFATLPPEIRTITFNWGALCGIGTAHALALGYGSLYNHDNPANLRYTPDPENLLLKFIAARDIAEGEELTINYNAAGGRERWDDNNWFERMNITPVTSGDT